MIRHQVDHAFSFTDAERADAIARRIEHDVMELAAAGPLGGSLTDADVDVVRRWSNDRNVLCLDPTFTHTLLHTEWGSVAVGKDSLSAFAYRNPCVVLPAPVVVPHDASHKLAYDGFFISAHVANSEHCSTDDPRAEHVSLHFFGRIVDASIASRLLGRPPREQGNNVGLMSCRTVVNEAAMSDFEVVDFVSAPRDYSDNRYSRHLVRLGLAVAVYLGTDDVDLRPVVVDHSAADLEFPDEPASNVCEVGHRIGAMLRVLRGSEKVRDTHRVTKPNDAYLHRRRHLRASIHVYDDPVEGRRRVRWVSPAHAEWQGRGAA